MSHAPSTHSGGNRGTRIVLDHAEVTLASATLPFAARRPTPHRQWRGGARRRPAAAIEPPRDGFVSPLFGCTADDRNAYQLTAGPPRNPVPPNCARSAVTAAAKPWRTKVGTGGEWTRLAHFYPELDAYLTDFEARARAAGVTRAAGQAVPDVRLHCELRAEAEEAARVAAHLARCTRNGGDAPTTGAVRRPLRPAEGDRGRRRVPAGLCRAEIEDFPCCRSSEGSTTGCEGDYRKTRLRRGREEARSQQRGPRVVLLATRAERMRPNWPQYCAAHCTCLDAKTSRMALLELRRIWGGVVRTDNHLTEGRQVVDATSFVRALAQILRCCSLGLKLGSPNSAFTRRLDKLLPPREELLNFPDVI